MTEAHKPVYVTAAQLSSDTLRLVPKLPPDVSHVVGVARSGMLPATLIASALHRPLLALDEAGEIRECGHGWRLHKSPRCGRVLVVDDTTGTGTSLRKAREVVKRKYRHRKVMFASIYVNPDSRLKPDVWSRNLCLPHILEWNLQNSIVAQESAFDMDGLLCPEFGPADDDDGPRYRAAMRRMTPLWLPRRDPVTIITARLEKYRGLTEKWLDQWGIQAGRLIMGPWGDPERRAAELVKWKCRAVREWSTTVRHPIYFESDPRLARTIAARARVLTVCPAEQQCYGGLSRDDSVWAYAIPMHHRTQQGNQ